MRKRQRKAAQIVAGARKERTERLNSARNEAMKEIDTFRYMFIRCLSICISLRDLIDLNRAQKQKELDEVQQKMAAVNTSHSKSPHQSPLAVMQNVKIQVYIVTLQLYSNQIK